VTIQRQLSIILVPEVIVLCFLITYFCVDLQSTATLLVFNALFISIFTQLAGSLFFKLVLLAAGNTVGMIWSFCFHQVIWAAVNSLTVPDVTLSMFYTVAYPSLNSLWVIAFWSLSLTALHRSKREAP
jgi:hypothetical protein